MAKVTRGFLLGTRGGLTFYQMDGMLYVRLKSSLSGKKVKCSPRFKLTMQSAGELGSAAKIASRIYRELSCRQRKMVFVLYKKMTGIAKKALSGGGGEVEAENEVRMYLIRARIVKLQELQKKQKGIEATGRVSNRRPAQGLFVLPYLYQREVYKKKACRNKYIHALSCKEKWWSG